MYVEISRIMTTVVSVGMIYALYDQAWKLWRTRSAKDFTVSIVIGIVANEFAWLNYGWAIREWPIIVVCCFTAVAAVWIAVGYVRAIRYSRREGGA